MVGDFNLPNIHWTGTPPKAYSHHNQLFLTTFLSLGLTQHVSESTFVPSGNILDLVFSSEPDRIASVTCLPPLPGCGHTPISFSYVYPHTFQEVTSLQISSPNDWFHANFPAIRHHISEIDWLFELNSRPFHDAYNFFLNFLHDIIDRFVPLKTIPHNIKPPPWNPKVPNTLTQNRSRSWNTYKSNRSRHGRLSPITLNSWHSYSLSNKAIKDFKIRSRISYENNLINKIKNNPKLLHSYLRRQKLSRPSVGPLLIDNTLIDDPTSMAEHFVEAFSSVLNPVTPLFPHPHQISQNQIHSVQFTINDVDLTLKNLNPSSSMGPDCLHPVLFKSCHASLSLPLYILFTRSLSLMQVPASWKLSHVSPIYKKGPHTDPLNYRPISLTSICSKSMERILVKSIHDHIDSQNILSSSQFGFRPSFSVQDQLILAYDYISAEYDMGNIVELVLFDFRKAFDLVPHSILLDKLSAMGFNNPLLGWFKDFLLGRTMSVVVGGTPSSQRLVTSGVPQGSVVGPLLFILFINHLTHDLSSKSYLFADDLKIFLGASRDAASYSDCILAIQQDIDLLSSRAESWGLSFAVQKCVRLRFVRPFVTIPPPSPLYIGNHLLDCKDSCRDLGILIDTQLKFHSHISLVSAKAAGMSSTLLRGTLCRSPEFMREIFITHIRPLLEFSSSVWNSGYVMDLCLLESVQRRWTKQIDGLSDLDYFDRLKSLSLFSVWGRLFRADLVLVWKILHGHIPSLSHLLPLANNHRTRGHPLKLLVNRTNTEVRRRFFTNRIVNSWNCLSHSTVTAPSLQTFKSRLFHELGDLLFYHHD